MTFSLSQFSAPVRASIVVVAAMIAAPAFAAPAGYSATLNAAPAETKVMVAGTVFLCKGADCSARESGNSPMRVCTALVKEAGPVSAFSFAGKAFDDAKLAKCNAAAA